MTGGKRSWIAGALLCVVVLSMATSATASTVRLTTPAEDLSNDQWAQGAMTITKPGVSYSLGLDVLCTRPKGTVQITGVRPSGVIDDLRVIAFGTRPDAVTQGRSRMGAEVKPLSALGFDTTSPVTVETACARDIDKSRPANFTDGETKGTLNIRIGLGLCGKDRPERDLWSEESDPPCAR